MEKRSISVVCIGDELLIGQVTDTNSGDIARIVTPFGWDVGYVQTVGDNKEDISSAIDRAFTMSDVVITTGGLGPTKDDISKEVLCAYFGGTLVENPRVLENVKEVVGKRGLKLNELTARQAIVPTSCKIIQNRVGTAPIMWFEKEGKILVAMPGVPFEMREMFQSEVFPRLRGLFPSHAEIFHHTIIVTDISESALATTLDGWEKALPEGFHLAYLPTPGLIRLRLDATFPSDRNSIEGKATFDRLVEELKTLCGEHFLYDGDKTPAEIMLEELWKRNITVSTAESCTGGAIASALTSIPGASSAFVCGVVAYSNEIKQKVLGVKQSTLAKHGAVSEATVKEMAEGVLRLSGADVAMATSGIAGPGGATPGKPIGTVAIAVATASGTLTKIYHFPGNRQRVVERSVRTALINAIRLIRRT